MPGVQRDGEQRTLLPLNGLLGLAWLPYRRGASPVHDVHDRVVHMALGFQFGLGGNFHQLEVVDFLLAQSSVGGLAPSSLPIAQRKRGEVLERASLIQRNALLLDKILVGAFYIPSVESLRLFYHRRVTLRSKPRYRLSRFQQPTYKEFHSAFRSGCVLLFIQRRLWE